MPLPGPDTRVVELRVPGLIGTSGESLLDSVGTVEVAGDGVGRIIRPADRLRRPAPGPVLQALGRSVPRTLEGYLWSRMTSGGAAKATWALLFPFSLANVAHWMLPPVPEGRKLAALLGVLCRALLRTAALLLTMLLMSQLAVVTLDLFAAQCLAPGAACLASGPSWLRDVAGVRTAIGVVPLFLVVLVLHRVSSAKWRINAPERSTEPGPKLPGDELTDGPDTAALRCLHTVAALATVALLLLGGPLRVPQPTADMVLWVPTLVLLGIAVLATAVRAHRLFGAVTRAVFLLVAAALAVAAAVVRTPLPAALPGTDDTVEGIGAVLLAVCVVFAVLLAPAALLARPAWAALPRRLRPWAGGWAAAPTLALAGLLGGGFGAGLAIALRQLLRVDGLRLPESYTLITVLWGGALAVTALFTVSGFAIAVPLRRATRGVPDVVRLMETSEGDAREAAAAWARASWERKYLHRIVLAIVFLMALGVAVLLAVRFSYGSVPGWLDPLSGLGVVALWALAAGLLRVVYTAATGPQRNRHLAAFTDLVCFWPRAAHPAVPPSYALKVVPELAERARHHLAEPSTRVVLAGYHVGGLLAVLTAARLAAELPETDRSRVGVLTAGAPLQWGYQRAFPALFPHDSLARLYGELDGRWRGLCRGTDTFGGGATTWRHQVAHDKLLGVGYLPDGGVGALKPAIQGPTGVLVLGGDHWLPDPMREPINGRRWVAGVRRHADYVADPEWDRAIVLAAGLERADMTTRLAEQVPLFGDLLGQPRRR
ncbi:hypothetical protein ABZ863_06640 [Saccharomonospora sp. NPDC046836]|uniref:hypothetical protein n=1 Tax=Saccharomonospora sp. NPDC046836 TaxID=3156921 RepID=UPI0033FA516E